MDKPKQLMKNASNRPTIAVTVQIDKFKRIKLRKNCLLRFESRKLKLHILNTTMNTGFCSADLTQNGQAIGLF